MSDRNDTNRKYVEAFLPDREQIARYVNIAKGHGRTMAQFAEECGVVSASTFSRIVNGNIQKPLSTELIRAIVENAADPEEIDYESLMRANGMVPEEEENKGKFRNADYRNIDFRNAYLRARENGDKTIKNIITDELDARGRMHRFCGKLLLSSHEMPTYKSNFALRRYSNFSVQVQGDIAEYWNFMVYNVDSKEHIVPKAAYRLDMEDYVGSQDGELEFHMKMIMDNWATLFLRDIWEPETLKDVKNSFVVVDVEVYNAFCDMLKDIKVNTWVSVILIDMENGEVVEEKILPRHDGKEMLSIFDEEKIRL